MDSLLAEPTVWCLLGRKAGDNAQVRALAEELGYAFEEKHIYARPWELLVHLGRRGGLIGIDTKRSSLLQAPWPDVLITSGRRNEPVAHWIRRQSGGSTRLVHIGRPWYPLDNYELIITTPQYFLPEQDNIVHNSLPLHRILPDDLNLEGELSAQAWQDLPRPWYALLVGGDSGRFVFTREKAKRLGRECNRLVAAEGGSLLISDSPRTSAEAAEALLQQITAPHYSYRCGSEANNPYRAFLATADQLIVTGESMSMLGEAVSLGKPLHIFDMGDGDTAWWKLPHNYRQKPLSHRLAMRFGPQRMRRDVGKIQQALIGSGRANWLGSESSPPPHPEENKELKNTAEILRQRLRPG